MIDEDDADSSLNQMTTNVRKSKRMKKPMKMRMKMKKEAERRERDCNVCKVVPNLHFSHFSL